MYEQDNYNNEEKTEALLLPLKQTISQLLNYVNIAIRLTHSQKDGKNKLRNLLEKDKATELINTCHAFFEDKTFSRAVDYSNLAMELTNQTKSMENNLERLIIRFKEIRDTVMALSTLNSSALTPREIRENTLSTSSLNKIKNTFPQGVNYENYANTLTTLQEKIPEIQKNLKIQNTKIALLYLTGCIQAFKNKQSVLTDGAHALSALMESNHFDIRFPNMLSAIKKTAKLDNNYTATEILQYTQNAFAHNNPWNPDYTLMAIMSALSYQSTDDLSRNCSAENASESMQMLLKKSITSSTTCPPEVEKQLLTNIALILFPRYLEKYKHNDKLVKENDNAIRWRWTTNYINNYSHYKQNEGVPLEENVIDYLVSDINDRLSKNFRIENFQGSAIRNLSYLRSFIQEIEKFDLLSTQLDDIFLKLGGATNSKENFEKLLNQFQTVRNTISQLKNEYLEKNERDILEKTEKSVSPHQMSRYFTNMQTVRNQNKTNVVFKNSKKEIDALFSLIYFMNYLSNSNDKRASSTKDFINDKLSQLSTLGMKHFIDTTWPNKVNILLSIYKEIADELRPSIKKNKNSELDQVNASFCKHHQNPQQFISFVKSKSPIRGRHITLPDTIKFGVQSNLAFFFPYEYINIRKATERIKQSLNQTVTDDTSNNPAFSDYLLEDRHFTRKNFKRKGVKVYSTEELILKLNSVVAHFGEKTINLTGVLASNDEKLDELSDISSNIQSLRSTLSAYESQKQTTNTQTDLALQVILAWNQLKHGIEKTHPDILKALLDENKLLEILIENFPRINKLIREIEKESIRLETESKLDNPEIKIAMDQFIALCVLKTYLNLDADHPIDEKITEYIDRCTESNYWPEDETIGQETFEQTLTAIKQQQKDNELKLGDIHDLDGINTVLGNNKDFYTSRYSSNANSIAQVNLNALLTDKINDGLILKNAMFYDQIDTSNLPPELKVKISEAPTKVNKGAFIVTKIDQQNINYQEEKWIKATTKYTPEHKGNDDEHYFNDLLEEANQLDDLQEEKQFRKRYYILAGTFGVLVDIVAVILEFATALSIVAFLGAGILSFIAILVAVPLLCLLIVPIIHFVSTSKNTQHDFDKFEVTPDITYTDSKPLEYLHEDTELCIKNSHSDMDDSYTDDVLKQSP